MSEKVERKLLGMLGNPIESPYGNPIPGLEELGARPTAPFQSGVVSSISLFDDGSEQVRARIRRIAEPAQVDPEQLRLFDQAGLRPGAIAEFRYRDGIVRITVDTSEDSDPIPIELHAETAAHLFVTREQ